MDENPKREKRKLNKQQLGSFLSLIFQTFQSSQPPCRDARCHYRHHALAHCDDGKLGKFESCTRNVNYACRLVLYKDCAMHSFQHRTNFLLGNSTFRKRKLFFSLLKNDLGFYFVPKCKNLYNTTHYLLEIFKPNQKMSALLSKTT